MTAFTITVDDAAVQAVLHKLASRAGGLTPVLQVVGEGMIERTKRRFETGTAPDGTPWKPNSAATLARA
jgi:phage gpG-like protein